MTIICLSFLIIGIFLSLSNNLRYAAQEISDNMVVVLFLEKDINDISYEALEKDLSSSPLVIKYQYINHEQATEKFENKFPDLKSIVDNLEETPFPASFEVTLIEKDLSSKDIKEFIERMEKRPGVEDIQYNKEWIERMQSLSRLAKAIGFFLGSILILASFFIISNVIKLNVFARRNEIEILKLVGGTNMFIRIPFLFEGIILGILGGLLSLILLFMVITFFPLYLGSSLGALGDLISFRFLNFSQIILLIGGCALIGFLGSFSSMARFLKQDSQPHI
jgi:cell division transport system permease protein